MSSAKYFLWMDANSHTSAKSNKHLTSCFTCKWGLLLRTATAFSFFLNPHVPSPYLSFCLLYFFAPVLSSTPSLRLLPGIDSWMSCQTLRAESWQSPCPSCRPVQFVCCASSKTSSTWCIPSLAKMNPLPIGQDVKETLRTGSIRGTLNNLLSRLIPFLSVSSHPPLSLLLTRLWTLLLCPESKWVTPKTCNF